MTHKDEELERILNEHCHCGVQKEYHKVIVDFILKAGYVKRDKVGEYIKKEFASWDFGYKDGYQEFCDLIDKLINAIPANAKSIIKIND